MKYSFLILILAFPVLGVAQDFPALPEVPLMPDAPEITVPSDALNLPDVHEGSFADEQLKQLDNLPTEASDAQEPPAFGAMDVPALPPLPGQEMTVPVGTIETETTVPALEALPGIPTTVSEKVENIVSPPPLPPLPSVTTDDALSKPPSLPLDPLALPPLPYEGNESMGKVHPALPNIDMVVGDEVDSVEESKPLPYLRPMPKNPGNQRLKHAYDFKRQVVPDVLYKRKYGSQNQHLPVRQTTEQRIQQLHAAVRSNDINGIRALLNAGVPINAVSPSGENPLILATQYGAHEVINLLLLRGASVNSVNTSNHTALHLAAFRNDVYAVRQLIKYGAYIDMRDGNNYTAVDYARRNGYRDLAAMIERTGSRQLAAR